MRNVTKFRSRRDRHGKKPWHPRRKKSGLRHTARRWLEGVAIIGLLVAAQFLSDNPRIRDIFGLEKGAQVGRAQQPSSSSAPLTCDSPYIIDGDTFSCGNIRIRLTSIDAPEMPDHCKPGRRCTPGDPFASKDYLKSITHGRVTCYPLETDSYGRTVAQCEANGKDLSCAMVEAGHAVERYGRLQCGF